MWPKYDKPFYFHFRDTALPANFYNGATVCLQPVKPGVPEFKVGIALCSGKDNFSKRIGRAISSGRAKRSKATVSANEFQALARTASDIAVKAAVSGGSNSD